MCGHAPVGLCGRAGRARARLACLPGAGNKRETLADLFLVATVLLVNPCALHTLQQACDWTHDRCSAARPPPLPLPAGPPGAQVSTELIRMAILWHEMWHEALEEASRQYFGESNVEAMLATLLPLHEMMARSGPTTLKEIAFVQARRRRRPAPRLHSARPFWDAVLPTRFAGCVGENKLHDFTYFFAAHPAAAAP